MKGLLCLLAVVSAFVYGCYRFETSEWNQESKRAVAAQRAADAKLRLVSTGPDGCKVYAFKPGDRWLYSTSCPNAKTSTNNEWSVTVQNGKSTTTRTESLTIQSQ